MTLFPTYFYKIMKAANPLVARVAASFYLFKLSKSGYYPIRRQTTGTEKIRKICGPRSHMLLWTKDSWIFA